MRIFLLVFLVVSGSLMAQKQKNFSFELQGNTFSGIGNNFIADGLGTFTGFGASFSGRFYKNMGLSLEYHKGFTDVKDISVFGDLQNPTLSSLEILGLYRYKVTDKFDVEGNLGFGSIRIISNSVYRNQGFEENGTAFILGAKALYSLTKNNSLYLVGSPRLYFLNTFTEIENSNADKYYSKATLFNLSLGLRIYF